MVFQEWSRLPIRVFTENTSEKNSGKNGPKNNDHADHLHDLRHGLGRACQSIQAENGEPCADWDADILRFFCCGELVAHGGFPCGAGGLANGFSGGLKTLFIPNLQNR